MAAAHSENWRGNQACKFFYGEAGCQRADCPFVHNIEERVEQLLKEPDSQKALRRLLVQADLLLAAQAERRLRSTESALREAFDDVASELLHEVASEAALESVSRAVTEHRTAMAATCSVVAAVAVVDDSSCPYLRASLFGELGRWASIPVDRAHAEDAAAAPVCQRERQERALAAFRARALQEVLARSTHAAKPPGGGCLRAAGGAWARVARGARATAAGEAV